MLKLGLGLAGGGLRAWREAPGHIAYKSPGHRYTEHCLARVTATLSEERLEDTVPHTPCRLYTHMHKCAGF